MMKNILVEINQIKLIKKNFREFGVVVGVIFLLISVYGIFFREILNIWIIGIGFILVSSGLIYPKILVWPYKIWMILSLILGLVFSNVILSVLYYIILTPTAFILKLARKDLLNLKINKLEKSYWKMRENKINNMENLY